MTSQQYWNNVARYYDFVTSVAKGVRIEVIQMLDINKNTKILDVCTGTGDQAIAFAEKSNYVIGIDFSKGMLDVARKKTNKVKFLRMKSTDIKLKEKFDIVCISWALHEMPLRDARKTISEMKKRVERYGKIIIVDYSFPDNIFIKFLYEKILSPIETSYFHEFLKINLKKFLEDNGLRVEKEKFVFGYIFGIFICLVKR